MLTFLVFCILMVMISVVSPEFFTGILGFVFWFIDVAFKFTIFAFALMIVLGFTCNSF